MSERRLLRLFFAIWPDAGTRDALAAVAGTLRKDCGGRAPPVDNLHLTLAFLGDVPAARLPELEAVAAGVDAGTFALKLDRLDWWRHQRLVWAGTQTCPDGLAALVERLAGRLQAGGFRTERRRYMPHVTLLRHADSAPAMQTLDPIVWRPAQFVLACSQPAVRGVRYQIMASWLLRDEPGGL